MKQIFSLTILATWLIMVLFSWFMSLQPNEIDLQGILHRPDMSHWLGQDDLGRSILQRLVNGAVVSLSVAVIVTLISAVTGIIIGATAGWLGGIADHILVRIIDLFMAFPGLLLAIALAAALGPGLNNLILALSIVGWVGFARLTRAQTLTLKQREHILAARAVGTETPVILYRHVLPLLSAPLMVEATFSLSSVIIAEAGLSFLGIGVQPPNASWGNMIRDGASYLLVAPHMVISPGIALALVVLAINLQGDRLRDSLDKKITSRSR